MLVGDDGSEDGGKEGCEERQRRGYSGDDVEGVKFGCALPPLARELNTHIEDPTMGANEAPR